MSHVFISYSHEDANFVTRLVKHCQNANIPVWLDTERLRFGEYWQEGIDNGIKNAFALLVVLSPHAIISPYVTYEWSFALGVNVDIIPVMCRQIQLDESLPKSRELGNQLITELEDINQRYNIKIPKPEIHPRLKGIQYIDLSSEEDNSPKWQELLTQIKEKQQNFRPHSVNVPREAPPIIHEMVKKLYSEDKEQRQKAIESLWDIDYPEAENTLIKALQHPLPDVRQWSARGLGYKGSKKAIPALSNILQNDKYTVVREWTFDALIKIGGDEIIPTLIIATKNSEQGICSKSIQKLGDMKVADAIPNLLEILQGEVSSLMEVTIIALGKIGAKEAVPDLIKMLQHGYPGIRKESAKALGDIRDHRAIPYLVDAHKDSDWQVSNEAAYALQKIKPEDIPYLLEAIEETDSYYRNQDLVVSILRSKGEEVVHYLKQDFQQAKSYRRKVILDALKGIDTPEAQEIFNKYGR